MNIPSATYFLIAGHILLLLLLILLILLLLILLILLLGIYQFYTVIAYYN